MPRFNYKNKRWLTLSYAGTDRSGSKGKTLSL